ncbi:hypothetical protein [Dongia sp.]|uniref:hypothetical protein n=1 Tax=Dongia sp. TaxID=1977262 RepID=UPI0035AF67F4
MLLRQFVAKRITKQFNQPSMILLVDLASKMSCQRVAVSNCRQNNIRNNWAATEFGRGQYEAIIGGLSVLFGDLKTAFGELCAD